MASDKYLQAEKDRAAAKYRAGYDKVQWPSDYAAKVAEELELWRAREACRKSAAYFAVLGLRPCPIYNTRIEYIEGPPERFRMCEHAEKMIRFRPSLMAAVGGAERIDNKEVEIVRHEAVCD